MGTCKSCNKVVNDSTMENRICENCRGLEDAETTTKISGALGYLNFFSWLILLLSLVAGGFVLFSMSYVETVHYIGRIPIESSKFSILGIIYGVAILFQGIFLSSLGFSIVYIAKVISKKETI